MSFKEEIYEVVKGHGVKYIDVDRNAVVNGVPSVEVKVYATDRTEAHEFTFAKANAMSAERIGKVITSYLRNRT